MLRNRVDPFGNIISTPARGMWMGNRGVIHDEQKNIVRPFKHQAWIICELAFKDRKRELMSPNRWTELFFLDEATAFAAGHRPCFECRRDDATAFKKSWINGNPHFGFDLKTRIGEIDNVLHKQRQERKLLSKLSDLPSGTFVVKGGDACLVMSNTLYKWTPFGYELYQRESKDTDRLWQVLTPESTVNALRAGYTAQVNLS